jgi:hypothetical protein
MVYRSNLKNHLLDEKHHWHRDIKNLIYNAIKGFRVSPLGYLLIKARYVPMLALVTLESQKSKERL